MRLIILCAIILPAISAQFAPAAAQSAITVTSLEDTLANDGNCTLREAIAAANSNSAVDACPAGSPTRQDTIRFAVQGPILLGSPLILGRGITLQGSGPGKTILDGQGTRRVLELANLGEGPTVIHSLAIRKGRADAGAGLHALSLPCHAGITIADTLFQENQADGDGGAILAGCGAWTISGSTLSNNRAANGGGMAIRTPPGGSGDTSLLISNSTFSANHEGALFVQRGDSSPSSVTIQVSNSTILNDGRYNIELAAENGQSQLSAVFSNTILSNRAGANCLRVHPLNVPPPSFASKGYNLVNSASCGFNRPGDIQVADLALKYTLGKLAGNGGPTPTHALLPGSPAIDAGNCSDGMVTADQRGIPRPQGPACDVGAYEFRQGLVYLPFIFP